MIKRIIKRIVRIFLLIFVLLLCWLIWELKYIPYAYETHCIKQQFLKNENVAHIDKMDSQKDFEACYDVYFTSKKGTKFVITNVQIKDGKIKFYTVSKTDDDFNRIQKFDPKSENLGNLLKEIDDF